MMRANENNIKYNNYNDLMKTEKKLKELHNNMLVTQDILSNSCPDTIYS